MRGIRPESSQLVAHWIRDGRAAELGELEAVSGGRLTWAPGSARPAAAWDFDVEID
jgi:hypothetical protein